MKTTEVNKELIGKRCECIFTGLMVTGIIEECYELPDFAKTYFDYEKFARDLFMCDYWFDDGFVFRAA